MPVKTIRGPLWKLVHPVKYFGGEYRKAKRAMRPRKVAMRAFSLDQVVRALGAQSTRVTAETRKKQVAKTARKVPAKKSAPKKTAAASKSTVVRKKNGQFNGREAMNPTELARFEQAEQRYVDPALLPRSARTRRRRPARY